MKYYLHLLAVTLLMSLQPCKAQSTFSATILTESIAFPFTQITPIHPGLEFGYIISEKQKSNVRRTIIGYAGWFFHQKLENAYYLRGEVSWGIPFKNSGTFDLYTGAGYMHVFFPGEVYELNQHSGDFEKTRQTGKPRALINIGLGYTYREMERLAPFIRQDLSIETPFANGITVIIHSFFKVGTFITIGS